MTHTKPTPEELENNIKATLENLSKPTEEEVAQEKELEEAKKNVEEVETKEVETKEEPAEVETEEKEVKPDVDYKKKFTESTREAQILHSKNKKINDAIEKAQSLPDPTEEELKAEFKEWDVMSETERKLATDNLKNKRALSLLGEVTKESKDIEAWNGKVDTYLDDPETLVKNPKLEGKTDEFKLFASKPSRRGVDFADLVSAFLYDVEIKSPPKKKGAMFEQGTGGPNEPRKTDSKLTVEQGRQLMNSNYNEYKRLLLAGKIANE